jgi:hypothetical protein
MVFCKQILLWINVVESQNCPITLKKIFHTEFEENPSNSIGPNNSDGLTVKR